RRPTVIWISRPAKRKGHVSAKGQLVFYQWAQFGTVCPHRPKRPLLFRSAQEGQSLSLWRPTRVERILNQPDRQRARASRLQEEGAGLQFLRDIYLLVGEGLAIRRDRRIQFEVAFGSDTHFTARA